jgi:hypothetical protein
MKIRIGDLVKLSNAWASSFGVSYGTVVDIRRGKVNNTHTHEAKVLMYNAGLGQFNQWIHIGRLDAVFPVGKL